MKWGVATIPSSAIDHRASGSLRVRSVAGGVTSRRALRRSGSVTPGRADQLEVLADGLAMAEGDGFAVEDVLGHLLVLLVALFVGSGGLLLAFGRVGRLHLGRAFAGVAGDLFDLAVGLEL